MDASTLIFSPGKFLSSQILPRASAEASAGASVNAHRCPLCLPLALPLPREYRYRRVNQETFDFLNTRLRSAFEGRESSYFTKREYLSQSIAPQKRSTVYCPSLIIPTREFRAKKGKTRETRITGHVTAQCLKLKDCAGGTHNFDVPVIRRTLRYIRKCHIEIRCGAE